MAYVGFKVEIINGVKHYVYSTGTKVKFNKPLPKVYKFEPKPCIYKVVDKTTNKIYIGSTTNMRNREQRYSSVDLKKGVFKGLHRKDLEITVLEYCQYLTKEDRLHLEYQYIKEYNSVFPIGNNKACPVNGVLFHNVDLNTYDPIAYIPTVLKGAYDKDKYQRNKAKISVQRKAKRQANAHN